MRDEADKTARWNRSGDFRVACAGQSHGCRRTEGVACGTNLSAHRTEACLRGLREKVLERGPRPLLHRGLQPSRGGKLDPSSGRTEQGTLPGSLATLRRIAIHPDDV